MWAFRISLRTEKIFKRNWRTLLMGTGKQRQHLDITQRFISLFHLYRCDLVGTERRWRHWDLTQCFVICFISRCDLMGRRRRCGRTQYRGAGRETNPCTHATSPPHSAYSPAPRIGRSSPSQTGGRSATCLFYSILFYFLNFTPLLHQAEMSDPARIKMTFRM